MKDEAPVQEPVGYWLIGTEVVEFGYSSYHDGSEWTPIYTTPPAAKRQWVRLSEDDIDEIFNNHPTYQLDHFVFAENVMSKYEEKNAASQSAVPDFLNSKDENPAYAAGWNDCRAEMLKGRSQ